MRLGEPIARLCQAAKLSNSTTSPCPAGPQLNQPQGMPKGGPLGIQVRGLLGVCQGRFQLPQFQGFPGAVVEGHSIFWGELQNPRVGLHSLFGIPQLAVDQPQGKPAPGIPFVEVDHLLAGGTGFFQPAQAPQAGDLAKPAGRTAGTLLHQALEMP